MKEMWRSDSCYGSYGVDGSVCSFFIYLSEVSPSLLKRCNRPTLCCGFHLKKLKENKLKARKLFCKTLQFVAQ